MTFRLKLALAMAAVVAAATAGALLVTQRSVAAAYRRLFADRFAAEASLAAALEEGRFAAVRPRCLELAKSVRLLAALEEGDAALLYRIARDELRDVLRPPPGSPLARPASFFLLLDAEGRVLPSPDEDAAPEPVAAEIARAARALAGGGGQAIGYVATGEALAEVIVTRVVDPVTRRLRGALAVGFPATMPGEEGGIPSGIWYAGRIYSLTIPATVRPALAAAVAAAVERPERESSFVLGGVPHRIYTRALHPEAGFAPAHQVVLYSLAEAAAAERRLRRLVLGAGALALLLGIVVSLVLAHGLSGPIARLVAAAGEIGRGNLGVRVPVHRRDEVGRLGAAFNDMAAGLALKEKYRSVLDLVSDRDVAQELVEGRLALGGELREATVLFCDIRGFTALTERMSPADVIELLNAHMTLLTEVVHAERGVVDKFVGDALMAVFGTPRSRGDDALRAVRAAAEMIAARARANAGLARPITIGIGVATGTVVAGCMGSTARMNYTVLGERVNLASRLAGQAGAMEVLIDETTRARIGDGVATDVLPALALKGFAGPVSAYRLVRAAAP